MMETTVRSELSEVIGHYDVGALVAFERNDLGYCNISYAVETMRGRERRRYFLRRYRSGTSESELQFEHSLTQHLIAQGLTGVARAHPTRDGRAFFQRNDEPVFYALFDFLPGEDRYTWINPTCSDREIQSAAATLARFHSATSDLQPQGRRAEPKIIELLPQIAANVRQGLGQHRETVFDDCLCAHASALLNHIEQTRQALTTPEYARLPQLVIHCDYHPGNLKFQGDQVVGLFDFNWSKLDVRCFDVALALFYFFASWQGPTDGELRLEALVLFLKVYQDTFEGLPGIGPLTSPELKYLPALLAASNLYVLNWTVVDFFSKTVDPQEYLVFLEHGLHTMQWLGEPENVDRLESAIHGQRAD